VGKLGKLVGKCQVGEEGEWGGESCLEWSFEGGRYRGVGGLLEVVWKIEDDG